MTRTEVPVVRKQVVVNTPVEQASGAPSIKSAISVFPSDPATYGLSLTIHEQ